MAAPSKTPPRSPHPAEEPAEPRSRLGWFIGWIVIPGLFLALIVGSGAYVGANYPDVWVTRAVLWLAGLVT